MKKVILGLVGLTCFVGATVALAGTSGIGGVAEKVTGNLGAIAKLITAASYVAGMAFSVGAIVKFKAHKDAPTQVPIGQPIAMLFVGAALLFIPSVMQKSGETLGLSSQATVAGKSSFG